MDRVRHRIGDKRVLGLVKAFLKAGILTEDGVERDTITGTPQGGILSPLLANIALSVLDEYFTERQGDSNARKRRRYHGLANYRLIRYADDFVVMVHGTEDDVNTLRSEVAAVLAPMGLRLSEEKTKTCHIDEGFDFLGFRIQRKRRRGSNQWFVYTWPSKKALASIKGKVRTLTQGGTNQPLQALLVRLNQAQGGWANYFRHGVSKATFGYLDAFTWRRVYNWLCHKHPTLGRKKLVRHYYQQWRPRDGKVTLFNPATVAVTRYRYRGTQIPSPWPTAEAPAT